MFSKEDNEKVLYGVLIIIIIVMFILVIICVSNKNSSDGFNRFILEDNAYSNSLLPSYSRKGGWPIPLPEDKEEYY